MSDHIEYENGIYHEPLSSACERANSRIAKLEGALAERDRTIKRLERCLSIWVGDQFQMATTEQNMKRIAVVKRRARAEEARASED